MSVHPYGPHEKFLAAQGVDVEALRVIQEAKKADPTFLHHARRRIMAPPWTVVQLNEDGGAYTNGMLQVITSVAKEQDGKHWLHVSCRRGMAIPSYDELATVKAIFIGKGRKAIMVLPAEADHVNLHPAVLHLFSPLEEDTLPDFTWGLGTL